jgi:hypothetical protein
MPLEDGSSAAEIGRRAHEQIPATPSAILIVGRPCDHGRRAPIGIDD